MGKLTSPATRLTRRLSVLCDLAFWRSIKLANIRRKTEDPSDLVVFNQAHEHRGTAEQHAGQEEGQGCAASRNADQQLDQVWNA